MNLRNKVPAHMVAHSPLALGDINELGAAWQVVPIQADAAGPLAQRPDDTFGRGVAEGACCLSRNRMQQMLKGPVGQGGRTPRDQPKANVPHVVQVERALYAEDDGE